MNRARTPLIAGNWKMHHGGASAVDLAGEVATYATRAPDVEVVVLPPFTALAAVAFHVQDLADKAHVKPIGVGAQNLHIESKGAFTGEISAPMLVEAGCSWVVVGHSERRQMFGDTDALVAKKTASAMSHGLHPIVCVGETLEERNAARTFDVVLGQLRAFLDVIAPARGAVVLAYEPIWAIGSGKVATPADAQAVHAAIRHTLSSIGDALAQRTRILYGGSVKGDNARSLLSQTDIDGALVGGASLEAGSFCAIIEAAEAVARG